MADAATRELRGEWRGDRFYYVRPDAGAAHWYVLILVRDHTLGTEEEVFGGPILY